MLLVTLNCTTMAVQMLVESLRNYLAVNLGVECHQMQMVSVRFAGCTHTLWVATALGQKPSITMTAWIGIKEMVLVGEPVKCQGRRSHSFLGIIMVRPGVNPHVETLGTRVRFTISPPYAYTSVVSQPNEISFEVMPRCYFRVWFLKPF